MASVEIQNVRKNFGATEVLKAINLSIADGEFIALVGPSGCGKSTLLRIIAGLEAQTSGEIVIDGRTVSDMRPSDRDLAMVFQSYALYPHLSVEQNMMVPLKLRALSGFERTPLLGHLLPSRWQKMRAIRKIIDETAETLKMKDLLKRKPGQLSGGQRQRVAVGRAMVRKPVAFLMDEPLSNLDAALRVHMRSEIADLHRQLATTFIYVTHDQAEALTMADRIAVMMEGVMLQVGSPDAVYRDPHELRVAEFIGSPKMNTLPGTADANGVVTTLAAYKLQRKLSKTLQNVTVGMRPEHLEIAAEAPGGHFFPVTVRHKENLGADYFVHAQIDGTDQRLIVRTRPETAQKLAYDGAAKVWALHGEPIVFGTDNMRIYFEGEQS
ncbi:MAG: ABC transporter ATP-binding protein [Pseudomonadota bacterium]